MSTQSLSFPGDILEDGVAAPRWGLVQHFLLQLERNCPMEADAKKPHPPQGWVEEATPTQGWCEESTCIKGQIEVAMPSPLTQRERLFSKTPSRPLFPFHMAMASLLFAHIQIPVTSKGVSLGSTPCVLSHDPHMRRLHGPACHQICQSWLTVYLWMTLLHVFGATPRGSTSNTHRHTLAPRGKSLRPQPVP